MAFLPLTPLIWIGFFNDDFVGLIHYAPQGWQAVIDAFHPDGGFLRPMGIAWGILELEAFGHNAWLFHLVHLVLFGLAAWVAGRLVAHLCGEHVAPWGSALALLYPARVETVAWFAAVFDLLALLIVSFTLLLVVTPRWSQGWGKPAAVGMLCAVGTLAKETAYSLPLIIVVWEFLCVLGPATLLSRICRCGAAFAGTGLAFMFRLYALGGVGGYPGGITIESFLAKLKSLPEAIVRVIFVPVNPNYGTISTLLTAVSVVVTSALLLAVLLSRVAECRRMMLAGLAIVIVGLLPGLIYLNPETLVWSHNRLVTIAGLGVTLMVATAGRIAQRGIRILLILTVLSWTGATLLNVDSWVYAARCREIILDRIEEVTRSVQRHVVYVKGPIDGVKGARLLGGYLIEAVRFSFPDRRIDIDSEYQQQLERRSIRPPCVAEGNRLHIFEFDPVFPRMLPDPG